MKHQPKNQQAPNTSHLSAAETVRELSVLALFRTAFSSERSVLSWMRTSCSLYSFGFSLIKFLDYLEQQQDGVQFSTGHRNLGLALIGTGMLVLVLALIDHAKRMRKMKQLGLPRVSAFSLPNLGAAALFAIGLATVVGIAFNQSG